VFLINQQFCHVKGFYQGCGNKIVSITKKYLPEPETVALLQGVKNGVETPSDNENDLNSDGYDNGCTIAYDSEGVRKVEENPGGSCGSRLFRKTF
jgi:hypothetical protein